MLKTLQCGYDLHGLILLNFEIARPYNISKNYKDILLYIKKVKIMHCTYTRGQKRLQNLYGIIGLYLCKSLFIHKFQECNPCLNQTTLLLSKKNGTSFLIEL